MEDTLGAGIVLYHAIEIIVRVVRQSLDGHEIARLDLDERFKRLAEIAPMYGFVRGRDVMVVGFRRRRHRLAGILGLPTVSLPTTGHSNSPVGNSAKACRRSGP